LKRFTFLVWIGLGIAVSAAMAAEHGGAGESGNEILWKLANFVVLAGALGYLIYKKAGAFFASRTAEIRRGIEEAWRLRKDAEERYAEIEQRLANIGADIESLRKRAAQESAAESERVRAETSRDMKKIQTQAEQEIEAAAKAARQDLRAYGAALAVDLAEKRIRERLTPDSDSVLVDAMLHDLVHRANAPAVRPS
jgi:F-type H+-transporting ATPase subunit b